MNIDTWITIGPFAVAAIALLLLAIMRAIRVITRMIRGK